MTSQNITKGPARYRQKVREFDAIQWTGSNLEAVQALIGADRAWLFRGGERLAVITLGERVISPGDWVLKFSRVDIAVCAQGTFEHNYEPAELATP